MKNQNKHIFNLYRNAVGTDWQRYRPQYEWFTMDSILSGSNPRWKELESSNPSLSRTMYAVKAAYEGYSEKFQERYNLSEQQVKQFYNVYVGYHPAYGAYMVGVGPYVGAKQADEENKFGYFTQRFPSTDSKNVVNLVKNYSSKRNKQLEPVLNHLGVENLTSIVSPEDFTLTVRHKKNDKKGAWGEVYDFIDINKDFLEKNDYQKSIEESRDPVIRPVLGLASKLQMKPSGVFKVLYSLARKDGQTEQLKNIIITMASQMGIAEEDIESEVNNNMGFMKRVSEAFAAVNPITPLSIVEPRVTGTQQPEALGKSPEQVSLLKLMSEICLTIDKVGSEDPSVVAQSLNSNRVGSSKRAQGTFTPEIVANWISNIQSFREKKDQYGNVDGVMSYSETSQFFIDSINAVDAKNNPAAGFDDMETALNFASLRVAESKSDEIDPVTGAKINTVPSVLEKTYQQNITSEDLTKMRNGEPIEWDKKDSVSDEDISPDNDLVETENVEFIDEPDIEDINITKEPVKSIPEPIPESIPEPVIDSIPKPMPRLRVPRKNAKPKPMPINNVEETLLPENQEAEVMAKIINKLQILSQDLNKKGFDKVSSNINQIINKYKRF